MFVKVTKKEFESLYPNVETTSKLVTPKKPSKSIKIQKAANDILRCPTEAQEGKKFWSWAQYHPIAKRRMFHVPNGGSRNVIEATNLKAQGTVKGIPDYFLAYPHKDKHGLFIELKRAKKSISRVTIEQAKWIASSVDLGYEAKVCYGADEAIMAVEEYLK